MKVRSKHLTLDTTECSANETINSTFIVHVIFVRSAVIDRNVQTIRQKNV